MTIIPSSINVFFFLWNNQSMNGWYLITTVLTMTTSSSSLNKQTFFDAFDFWINKQTNGTNRPKTNRLGRFVIWRGRKKLHFQKWKKNLQSKRDWKRENCAKIKRKTTTTTNKKKLVVEKVDGKVTKYGFNKPARCVDGDVKVSKQAN